MAVPAADAVICRSPADRRSMTEPPGDMTEIPDRGKGGHGRIIRRIEGTSFDPRLRVSARRFLRALVHRRADSALSIAGLLSDRRPT